MEAPIVTNRRTLNGTVTKDHMFRFTCGFKIPVEHVEWAVGAKLRPGNQVTVELQNIVVASHAHRFKCECGETHS